MENKPLYAVIFDHLKQKIENGEYLPEQQIPTEVELAEQFGVSRITSKRALIELERDGLIYRKRGSGSFVKRREESDQVLAETSVQGAQNIISMILPYMATNTLLDYIRGASDLLESRGYYLSIHSTDWSKDKEKELLTRLPKQGFVGIILYPLSTIGNIEIINALHLNDYPLVTIDQYFDSIRLDSVVSDNFAGGYEVASKLIELGHERIAFVSSVSIEYRSSVRDRYFGYCKALRDHGLPIDSSIVVTDFSAKIYSPEKQSFYLNLVKDMLQQGVTAIQAEHDLLAVDIVRTALDLGVSIPDELSIAGFDNHEISQHVEIPLTTVIQNNYEIGRTAAELILSKIETGETDLHRVKVPVELVERQSTAPRNDELSSTAVGDV